MQNCTKYSYLKPLLALMLGSTMAWLLVITLQSQERIRSINAIELERGHAKQAVLNPSEAAAVTTKATTAADLARSLKTLPPSKDRVMCKSFDELRNLDFQQTALQDALCSGVKAYEKKNNGFPLCRLPNPFDERILGIVRSGSATADLLDMSNTKMKMFVYAEKDAISEAIKKHHIWESNLVHATMRLAQKVPDVTFLDAGCNIGVYSLLAARLGLPVVSLDANIRNLLRLRLSLTASALDTVLVWNFISSGDQLSYLNFPRDCNVGGATKFGRAIADTIPVMPVRSERLCDHIKTKNVVIKLDIEGGEADFLRTSGCLFSQFNVAAVQMEFLQMHMQGNDRATIVEFFTTRNYTLWESVSFKPLNVTTMKATDVIWIHENFKYLVHPRKQ